jgi:hypothetical protein
MAQENWRKGPLGDEVEKFLGEKGPQELYARAICNWDRWLQLTEGPRCSDFTSSLSISQFNTHRILLELWLDEETDRELLKNAVDYFYKAADSIENGPKPGDLDYRLPSTETYSAFQASIFSLVQWEFFCAVDEGNLGFFLVVLHEVRREAAMFVACSRLARQCRRVYLGKQDDLMVLSQRTVALSSEHQRLRSSWKRDSLNAGASIEPCPWLDMCVDGGGLPYYLWDRQERKTVVVPELKERPRYVAISHTWGRWKIDGPCVSLTGCPWPIPRNTRFKVADLGDILQAVPFSHRYIWLDLICIPQDRSERAKLEISCQATIFREAAAAIMWLNDVTEWKVLPAAIEWMCHEFNRKNEVPSKEPESMVVQDAGISGSSRALELFNSPLDADTSTEKSPVNPWFTSLWTLQEICLRPDILLCNATWDLLMVGDVAIAFDELVALNHVSFKDDVDLRDDESPNRPKQVVELASLLRSTGLFDLLAMSRPTILVQGNHRHCTERRAEAIMAVLGATDWFSVCSEDSNEENLILNRYPLGFVNEVRAKVGPGTFFSSDSVQPYFVEILSRLSLSPEVNAVGSMLPFGPGWPKVFRDIKSEPHQSAHSSVDTWTVEEPGCVRIKEAVIVASSTEDPVAEPMPSVVFGPVIGLASGRVIMPQTDVDLHMWVRSYEPSFPNYAVCIFVSLKGSTGIILKEIAPGILVKIGSYWQDLVAELIIPESVSVDWLVL